MLYVIPDTLLKVSLNTNKTGHHVIRYTWHIVEWTWWLVLLVFNNTFNNVSGITYDMLASFIGINATNKTGHHVIRYTWDIVESIIKHQ
jgi:hypothetical protein